jgi:uncharacterized protein
MLSVVLSAILALCAARATAALPEIPPSPTRWVTDNAGLISAATRDSLDQQLESFERDSGHQLLVYIDRTTGGIPIEDFAAQAFKKWRAGRKGLDDGLILFIFSDDRRLRIEVGYGLEGTVPDALAGRIVRSEIAPRLAAGQPDAAVAAGVSAMVSALGGPASVPGAEAGPYGGEAGRYPARSQPQELGWGGKILIGVLVLVFLVILITNPRLALWILFNLLMSGRGGGGGGFGGGGGGGFSGGGGRSGGGGASGSW